MTPEKLLFRLAKVMTQPSEPNFPSWQQNIKLMTKPLNYLEALGREHGDVFKTAFGPESIVLVSHPAAIQKLFNSTKQISTPGDHNQMLAPLVGANGLLLLSGAQHRQRRKLVMPAFHGDRIGNYGQQVCAISAQALDAQRMHKPFTLYPLLQRITLNLMLETLLGFQHGARHLRLKKLLPAFMGYARNPYVETALAFPALQKDLGRWSPWGHFLHLRQQFRQLIDDEIDSRRQMGDRTRLDLLSELIFAQDDQGNTLTTAEVRDSLPSILFAGRDASSAAIAWIIYWIHRRPDVRRRLLAELTTVDGVAGLSYMLENPGGSSSAQANDLINQLTKLPYLTAACKEALRIYPTQVITFPRRVDAPIELQGYTLTPGAVVRGNIYLTHRRPDLYPDPQQFRPERFLERQFSPYEFLPFGGGSRRCPGETLALFEMKLVVATLLSRYEFNLASQKPEQPKRRGVNFPPGKGVKLVMRAKHRIQQPAKQQPVEAVR